VKACNIMYTSDGADCHIFASLFCIGVYLSVLFPFCPLPVMWL